MVLTLQPYISVDEYGLSYIPSLPKKWSVDVFLNEFQTSVNSISPELLEFDLINIDCTFANALRRILVAEVPSFAIDRIYLKQNTSVIPDEIFCHRVGLIPLNIDSDRFQFCVNELPSTDEIENFDSNCHILFQININAEHLETKPEESIHKKSSTSIPLYSKSLTWLPLPGQEDSFLSDGLKPPAPVSDNILLNKLSVGDEIQCTCLAIKGIGRDHAKFSPVSAAFYKLLPTIELKQKISGDLAKLLQSSFAKDVITVDPKTHIASVNNARLDNGSREHLRHPELSELVNVRLNPNHFLFTVESIAPNFRTPDILVKTAIDIILAKCSHYLAIVERPGFASIPMNENSIDPSMMQAPSIETASTSLNGRIVDLVPIFISQDLQRTTFKFTGEDHTLGAALRFCILQSDNVRLCGYCQPHPLEDAICFEIQTKGDPAVSVLQNGLYCLRACFEHIKRKFISEVKKFTKNSSKHSKT